MTMKLSVMLFPFHNRLAKGVLNPDAFIKTLRDNGADAVEPMHGFENTSPEVFDSLLRATRENGLAIACYDIGINLVGPAEDRPARLDQARAQIAYAHDVLHCPTVLLYNTRQADGVSNEEGRKLYAQSLALMADYAESCGITVTIEDFDPTPELACAAPHCREILDLAGPKPRQTFDTGNFLAAGGSAPDAFPVLQDRIAHVHIKDVIPNPEKPGSFKQCIAGQGIAEIDRCVQLLKNSGYQGYLSVELNGGSVDETIASLHHLKNLIS